MPQRDTFVIMGLRRKRARLAGEIELIERQITAKREALAHVDTVLRIFEPVGNPDLIPSIRPAPRGLLCRHGEQILAAPEALREARGPLQARRVAEYAMAAKGLPVDDAAAWSVITEQVRVALGRLEKKGKARRVMWEPEVWWELVG